MVAVFIVIIIPFIEEVIFRFHLKFRNKFVNIYFPLFLIFFSFLMYHYIIVLLAIIVISLVSFIVYKKSQGKNYQAIWENKFNLIFYSTTFLFALMHLGNYDFSLKILLLFPVLVLPQFIGGLLIGYLRIKSGFLWGIMLHMLSNAVLVLPIVISLACAFSSFDVKEQNYELKVEKIGFKSIEEKKNDFIGDTIVISSYTFKECLSFLLNKNQEKIIINETYFSGGMPTLKANILLNIKYKNLSKNQITKVKENILLELQKAYKFKLKYNKDIVEVEI